VDHSREGRLLEHALVVPGLPPPSADEQLAFLAKLQRIFAEGDFTATYKFALLIALADLAVERGADNGDPLPLETSQLAERFIQLYWKHVTPYATGSAEAVAGILRQNTGAQAAVVTAITAFRARVSASNPQVAARDMTYPALVREVALTVSAQPLSFLQNFGGTTDEFIYERAGRGQICLKPGVTYCLRRFQPLIQRLSRSRWVEHIKRNRANHSILGRADDLEEFLFETSRQSLMALGASLRKLDGGHCFYCGRALASIDVDHFIPFSQYPRDLANNFVLAHPNCNRSKSDMLAAKRHLEHWVERLVRRADEIAEIGADVGFVADANLCKRVASWGYSRAYASQSSAWVAPSLFEHIDESYLRLVELA